jgi:hypothetical protein
MSFEGDKNLFRLGVPNRGNKRTRICSFESALIKQCDGKKIVSFESVLLNDIDKNFFNLSWLSSNKRNKNLFHLRVAYEAVGWRDGPVASSLFVNDAYLKTGFNCMKLTQQYPAYVLFIFPRTL